MKLRITLLASLLGTSLALAPSGMALSAPQADAGAVAPMPPLPQEPLRIAAEPEAPVVDQPAPLMPERKLPLENGKMQIEAADPETGQTVNIDINSKELIYNPENATYTVTGDVYIIIPEKGTEILADRVTFNTKTSNMVAVGHVFVINDKNILGSEEANYDLENEISTYKHPRTMTDHYKLQAEDGTRTETYTILRNGRFVLDEEMLSRISRRYRRRGLRLGQGSTYSFYSAARSRAYLDRDLGRLAIEDEDDAFSFEGASMLAEASAQDESNRIANKPISPQDIENANFDNGDSRYRMKVKRINIHRKPGGFDEITLSQGSLRYKNTPVMILPFAEFGYQEDRKFLTYLGPDIGYNPDYGGMYVGPGWDFRFLNGWVRYSPILSYGGGRRLRASGNQPTIVEAEPGIGFLGHFRSPDNSTDFGYGSTLREPIFLSEQRLFGRSQTRLRLGANQYYTNGFFGIERPNLIGELTDLQQFRLNDTWRLRTFVSAGVARDEFFPTRQRVFFVDPSSNNPITTTRLQLQGQLRTTNPLLYLGNFGALGLAAQGRLALYGTGDAYFVGQGGPFLNLLAGPLYSQVRYFYSQTAGETPFVFDSYFQGRNNIQAVNALDLGQYLTVGMRNGFSINRDNARNDLLVDQKVFASVGSKHVRFSVAYDTIQRRSFFGLTINPEGGQLIMDFDTLNMYQPGYDPSVNRPPSVVAPKKPAST